LVIFRCRFNVDKDDFPVILAFKRTGAGPADYKIESARFKPESDKEFKAENIKSFLRHHTGIYLPLAGCIESLDGLADRILATDDKKEWEKVVKEAESEAAKVGAEGEKQKKRADLYVKIMKKIVSDGLSFIEKETARTNKLMEGKITEAKKGELAEKVNILRSFTKNIDQDKKEEL
jgi:endoplasmic reticulum protein 29